MVEVKHIVSVDFVVFLADPLVYLGRCCESVMAFAIGEQFATSAFACALACNQWLIC